MGAPKKVFSKGDILSAMDKTKSVRSLSRYLGCSYLVAKRYMQLYTNDEGKTLFEVHKNPQGKGVPKFLSGRWGTKNKLPALEQILSGLIDPTSFDPRKIRISLIEQGYFKEECSRCGFSEYRVSDNKIPLILNFKNGKKNCYKLENLELLCYNCFFICVSDLFTNRDLISIEDNRTISKTTEAVKFELDDYQLDKMKLTPLPQEEIKEFNIISYK